MKFKDTTLCYQGESLIVSPRENEAELQVLLYRFNVPRGLLQEVRDEFNKYYYSRLRSTMHNDFVRDYYSMEFTRMNRFLGQSDVSFGQFLWMLNRLEKGIDLVSNMYIDCTRERMTTLYWRLQEWYNRSCYERIILLHKVLPSELLRKLFLTICL